MEAHGGFNPDRRRCGSLVCFYALVLCCALPWGAVRADSPIHHHLRIQWQDESGANVRGTIALDQGRFEDVRNLSFDGATTGSLRLSENDRSVTIAARGKVATSGVLLRAVAPADARLAIEFPTEKLASNSTSKLQVSLSEVTTDPALFTISPGRKVWISRVAGDRLRVISQNQNCLKDCGGDWPLEIWNNGCELDANRDYQLRCEIVTAREGKSIATQNIDFESDGQGHFAPIPMKLKVPDVEGVYDLNVRVTQSQRFQRERTIEWHHIQFVALQSNRPERESRDFDLPRSVPYSAEASKDPSWLRDQLTGWLPGNGEHAPLHWAVGAIRLKEVETEACLELGAGEAYAMELTKLVVNKPHQLIIRVPASQPTKLQACIAEPDVNSKFLPIQVDTAIVVPTNILSAPENWLEHRVVFWPKTERPVLILVNHHSKLNAVVAPPQVCSGIDHLPSDQATSLQSAQGTTQRFGMMYLAKPTIAEAFGVSLDKDPENNSLLHDWVAFYSAGMRLIEYLKWSGYQGAMINVCSEGGTLYPTEKLASTARYDSGAFFTRCRDPIRKDVLELLLRLFDREGLKLTPIIEFSAPLQELETQLAEGDVAEGIEPINDRQERLIDRIAPVRGQAVYYNALDARVQNAMKHVVQEIYARYQEHAAFAGIALQLGGRQYVQLPEAAWTLDKSTLAKFSEQLPGKLSEGVVIIDWVTQTGRPQFLQWRARQHSAFITSLARSLNTHPLYLVGNDHVYTSTELTTPELEYGWDWESLASQTNIIPLRYYRNRPLSSLAQQIQDTTLEGDVGMDRRMGVVTASGAIAETPPEKVAIPKFLDSSPWQPSQAPEFLLPHAVNSSDDARLRLARLLGPYDRWPLVIGGWTPPRGTENVTRDWLRVYQSLPNERFENVVSNGSDAKHGLTIVRRLRTRERFYLYAVNLAPWAVTLKVDLKNPKNMVPQWLGQNIPDLQIKESGIRTNLTPGAIVAFRFESAEVDVEQWSTIPCADNILAARCAEKLNQLSIATHDGPSGIPSIEIANGDFELNGDHVPLWNVAAAPGTRVYCDKQSAATGQASLCLECEASNVETKAWAVSSSFQVPTGTRLAVTARIKPQGKPKSTVSMTLEAKVRGQPWRRTLSFPAYTSENNTNPIWPAIVHKLEITDLPPSGVEELRIAFDLTGQGRVWIDDVKVQSILLTSAERKTIQEDLYLAIQKLKGEDVSAAGRLLAFPWTRELISYTQSVAQAVETPIETGEKPKPPVKSAERVRSWIPKLLR